MVIQIFLFIFAVVNITIFKEGTMKGVLLFLILALTVTAEAQEIEVLNRKLFDADPMTGQPSGVLWSSEHVGVWLPDKGLDIVRLKMKDHIFIKNYMTRIGYYTSDDKLIGMGTAIRATPTQDGTRMDMNIFFAKDSLPFSEYSDDKWIMKKSWRLRVKDMMKWLKETDGYLRITTQTYGGYLYDIRFRLKNEE